MGDAPARYGGDGRSRHLPAEDRAGRDVPEPRRAPSRRPELLDECITEFPGFVGVVGPYATALLAGGATPDAVVSEIESRVDEVTLAVRFVLGTVLYDARRDGRRRAPVPRGARRPPDQLAGPRGACRGPASPAPLRRRSGRGRRRHGRRRVRPPRSADRALGLARRRRPRPCNRRSDEGRGSRRAGLPARGVRRVGIAVEPATRRRASCPSRPRRCSARSSRHC